MFAPSKIATLYIGHDVSAQNDDNKNGFTHKAFYVRYTIEGVFEANNIDGYTVTEGTGMWEGSAECSTIVTVCLGAEREDQIREAAQQIAQRLRQDAVLVTLQACTKGFVTA